MTRAFSISILVLWVAGAACTSTRVVVPPVDPSQPPPECFARESGDAGSTPAEPIRCAGEADAAGGRDCPQGYRCNTALPVPTCQRLYCGPAKSLCSTPEVCVQGAECYEGRCTVCNVCGDKCAVDFASDPKNCGTCGNVVPTDRSCVGGVPTCIPPLVECDGACIDTRADPANCGACHSAVPPKSVCQNGKPACASGFLTCKGKCIDPADEANCTGCGLTCSSSTTCTKLGGGGCLGRVTVSTNFSSSCDSICSQVSEACVDGTDFSFATYQGSSMKRPATCSSEPPQTIQENGVEHSLAMISCGCLFAPR